MQVGKKEFIQHTSKYLKVAETQGETIVITHHHVPCLTITPVKKKTVRDLRGTAGKIKVFGDINDHTLPEIDKW